MGAAKLTGKAIRHEGLRKVKRGFGRILPFSVLLMVFSTNSKVLSLADGDLQFFPDGSALQNFIVGLLAGGLFALALPGGLMLTEGVFAAMLGRESEAVPRYRRIAFLFAFCACLMVLVGLAIKAILALMT